MIQIGIIDDVPSDREDIKVSILDNFENKDLISFKDYVIEKKSKELLFKEIQTDIIENRINGLIVDFKLDTTADIITGAEIVDFMHEETPDFPVVILTNVPDDSKESDVTDADKVYAKKIFLNTDSQESKSMVHNIMLNIRKYMDNRGKLEGELDIVLNKLLESPDDEHLLSKVIELENNLSKYKQIFQSSYTNRVDLNSIRELAELLEKYKSLQGE